MRITVLGGGPNSEHRTEALRSLAIAGAGPAEAQDVAAGADPAEMVAAIPADTGIVFAAGVARHYAVLSEIARRGIHLFLDWPPGSSVPECRALAELAREAGVEIGVSRPLRFHSWSAGADGTAYLDVVSVRQALDVRIGGGWKRALEDAVDLAIFFARGAAPRRIDASVARTEGRLPLVTLAGIRFQNGTYAQVEIRHVEKAEPSMLVGTAGQGLAIESDLGRAQFDGVRRETVAFLEAIVANRPPPVTVLDALPTMRLLEALMERLRH